MEQSKTQIARDRWEQASTYWSKYFARVQEEMAFLSGKQWSDAARQQREMDGRPCLTLNKIANYIRNLNTRNREAIFELKVENSDVINQLLQNVVKGSNLTTHCDVASYTQIATGLSYLRVFSEYASPTAFNQNVKVEAIPDVTSVFYDPSARGFLFDDADYCFIISQITKDEYANLFEKEVSYFSDFKNPFVLSKNKTMVAEYYYREWKKATIRKYVNPQTGEIKISDKNEELDETWVLVNSKKTRIPVIKHCLFDGTDFYEETTLPNISRIPVIPVVGEDAWINKQREFNGAVRNSMDAQKLTNYAISLSLEMSELQTHAPVIVEDTSITGYEDVWRDSNIRNYAYLPVRKGAQMAPQRLSVTTDISSLMSIKADANSDIQQIFGVFDTQLGDQSNEVSGVAINARNEAAAKSTYVYKDNLIKSIKEVGRTIYEMLPTYYNGRSIDVDTPSGKKTMTVQINPLDEQFTDELGTIEVVETSSSSSIKHEVNKQLLQLSQAIPSAAPLLVDFIIKNTDVPNKDELIERVSSLIPANVQNLQNITPENAKSIVSSLEAENQKLQEQMMQMQQEIQSVNIDKEKLEIEKQRIILDEQKAKMEYDIRLKQLQVQATEIEVDKNIEMHKLQLADEKLALESVGVQTDAIDI